MRDYYVLNTFTTSFTANWYFQQSVKRRPPMIRLSFGILQAKPIFVSFIVPRVTFSVVFDLVLINWFQRVRGPKLQRLLRQIPQPQYSQPIRSILPELRKQQKRKRKPTIQTRQNPPRPLKRAWPVWPIRSPGRVKPIRATMKTKTSSRTRLKPRAANVSSKTTTKST